MPRRGDNIRKRKDGRWEARYPRPDPGGTGPRYGSVYGKTYQEAKEKRDKLFVQGLAYTQPAADPLLRDVLEAWQAANRIRLKPASVCRYQNIIDAHILPTLGQRPMGQLNAAVINQFLLEKLENGRLDQGGGLSPAYVRSMSLILSSAISYGAEEHLCPALSSSIAKPPISKKEPKILDETQQALLESKLLEDMDPEKLMICLTLYSGIRIGEACALQWEDVDLEARLLYIRRTVSRIWIREQGHKQSQWVVGSPKTPSSLRCIPICSKLHTLLLTYPGRQTQGFVLSAGEEVGFLSPRTFEYRYKMILKGCGLEPVNYHALRHTFASRCIQRGMDVKTLAELLGHADASITLRTYVHSSMAMKRQQIEKLVP